MSASTAAQKEALRARMRRVRGRIPPAERARLTDMVEEALFALPEVRAAGVVLLFYSFGTEVPTGGMAARAAAIGSRVLLPFLDEEGMDAAEIRPGDPLASSGYGPREPPTRVAVDPEEVDVVVAPGLAFDRTGTRLGYGGGHYDRYLARLRPSSLRVGVAFSLQLVEEVPRGPEDEPVHLVVTDAGVIDCR